MSQRIDRFIQAMFRKGADRLRLLTGTPVRIFVGDEERVVLDRLVRTEQIDKLVIPILSDDDADAFCDERESSFTYVSPHGPVRIESRRSAGHLQVEIFPQTPDNRPPTREGSIVKLPERGLSLAAVPESDPEPAPARRNRPMTRSFVPSQLRGSTPSPPVTSVPAAGRGAGASAGIDQILRDLAKHGGSDLHLTTGQPPKMRHDGQIVNLPQWADRLVSGQIENWMLEVAAKRIREQFHNTGDADYAYEIPGVSRFRMNIFKDRNGTGGVIRTIPTRILTADELGLPPAVRSFCDLPKGLVLVTGPTGSGKSTTLAAMVDLVNKSRREHIITIEDPVEFVHDSIMCLVNQREVHTHTESFAKALRAALREDPDIVLVGELRDLETVSIALETAETGHLVFGTLHTNTAVGTVDRIIDQFPTDQQSQIRVMLSESLKGVVSQTLCRRVNGGRVAALEILVVTPAVANLIREGKTFQVATAMQTGKGIGMQTNTEALVNLVAGGDVTPYEAWRNAVDQAGIRQALERMGHRLD